MNIQAYWDAALRQDAEAMLEFFALGAVINWHNTNERFTPEEFIRANCEYPGNWAGEIEKLFSLQNQIITVVHVYSADQKQHFHVTSIFCLDGEKIGSIDEYWGDDGEAPQWRKDLHIGRKIKE